MGSDIERQFLAAQARNALPRPPLTRAPPPVIPSASGLAKDGGPAHGLVRRLAPTSQGIELPARFPHLLFVKSSCAAPATLRSVEFV